MGLMFITCKYRNPHEIIQPEDDNCKVDAIKNFINAVYVILGKIEELENLVKSR